MTEPRTGHIQAWLAERLGFERILPRNSDGNLTYLLALTRSKTDGWTHLVLKAHDGSVWQMPYLVRLSER